MELLSLLNCQQLQYFPKCFSLQPHHRLLFPARRKINMLHASPVTTNKTAVMSSSSSSNQITSGKTSTVERRSAEYKPNIWDFKFLQSLRSEYTGETYEKQSKKLQEAVRHKFNDEEMNTLAQLELIDNLERLGIGYLFRYEIKRALDKIVLHTTTMNNQLNQENENLHAVSLHFKLLRRHGYEVSQDVFAHFLKDNTIWKPDYINENDMIIKGILNFYEASHLAYEGEIILDEAKILTTKYLNEIINKVENSYLIISPEMVKQVKHSLELPLHWRMPRLESRWYIDDVAAENDEISSNLVELAKLDFNMVQAIHQDEVRDISMWWRDLGLGGSDHQFNFARHRLLECFIWCLEGAYEPQFHYCRRTLTKCCYLVTIIDDVYDLYGTLGELELFTDAVIRWNINDEAMEQLPGYMKICFQALYNTVKEIANDTLTETGGDTEYYLKKEWGDLCKAYLVEAKWHHNNYTPSLEEYLNNACISIAGSLALTHCYLSVKQEMSTKEGLECLETYTDFIRWSSMIVRLCNDLGTSTAELQRGDVAKSIQCYMKESGVSEDAAREHIKHLTTEAWKKFNKLAVVAAYDDDEYHSLFTRIVKEAIVNMARTAQCFYLSGDGHGVQDHDNKERVSLLLVKPI